MKVVPVAAACIEDGEGNLLLVKRTVGREPSSIGRYEFPGGKVEKGESPIQALHREVLEELGFKLRERPVTLLHAQVNSYDSTNHYLVLFYLCYLQADGEVPVGANTMLRKPHELLFDDDSKYLPGVKEAAIAVAYVRHAFSFVEADVTNQTSGETLHVMTYELGKVIEYYHKAKRYGATGYYSEENQKKEMGDLISMVRFYCEQRGWDYNQLERLGETAYLERMEDLRNYGKK